MALLVVNTEKSILIFLVNSHCLEFLSNAHHPGVILTFPLPTSPELNSDRPSRVVSRPSLGAGVSVPYIGY